MNATKYNLPILSLPRVEDLVLRAGTEVFFSHGNGRIINNTDEICYKITALDKERQTLLMSLLKIKVPYVFNYSLFESDDRDLIAKYQEKYQEQKKKQEEIHNAAFDEFKKLVENNKKQLHQGELKNQ